MQYKEAHRINHSWDDANIPARKARALKKEFTISPPHDCEWCGDEYWWTEAFEIADGVLFDGFNPFLGWCIDCEMEVVCDCYDWPDWPPNPDAKPKQHPRRKK
jgi:hypothetical protein